MIRVPFVCVNYGAPADTLAFVTRHAGPHTPVTVVDNSPQPSAELAQACAGPHAHYHFAQANLGYLNGLGRGVELALAQWPDAEFVLLSNVDLEFSAEQLLAELAAQPALAQWGVLGPAIVSGLHHRAQNPFLRQRPSRWRMWFWETLARWWPLGALYQALSDWRHQQRGRHRSAPPWPSDATPQPVYAVHGSIFLLSRGFVECIRPLHWPCFLFGEEIWLAEQARQQGWGVAVLGTVHVTHREHVVIGGLPSRRKMAWHHQSIGWLRRHFWN